MKKLLLIILTTVFCLSINSKVTLDFSDAANDWGIPQSTANGTHYYDEASFTNGTYTISLGAPTASGNGYYYNSGGYLMLCEMGAYLKLPVFDFAVGTIVVEGHSGGSTAATMNIFVGDTAVSTEATDTSTDHTYVIDSNYQAVGTQYVYENTSSKNLQVVSITVYAVGEEIGDDGGTSGDEPSGHGYEPDDPYTVSELIPIIEALPSDGTITKVYVKGIITYVEEVSPSYGNMTYYISDDGTRDVELCIYRGKSLNGSSPTSEDEIQDGDEVIVYGTFTNYKGNTPEGKTGETQIYSLNGQTSDTGGGGVNTSTADNPYSVSELIPIIEALSSGGTIEEVYVKGIISQIDELEIKNYGNATYYISDDGSRNNELCIYRGYSLNNEKFTSSSEIEVGDIVVVYGTFTNYMGNTPEGATGKTYIYSLEKGEGGTVEPGPEVEIGGLETFENGGFEEWNGSYPVGWHSTTSASNATLTQSSEAYEGSYSVQIPYSSSSNYRLASKEFLLSPGTYYVSFYAKSVESDGMAHIATGYAPWNIEDDKMGTYVYSDYYDIPSDEWTEIEWEFTLEEETQLNLVVMNQRSGESAVLVDNYSITSDNVEEDGILSIPTNATYEGVTYNLGGQKVSDSYRGIVVVNGKKYLKK